MPNINVNIRMDEALKKQFETFCADVGMSMTTAFNMFAKATVREKRIPFEITTNSYNAETMEAFKEAEYMKKNPSFGKTYDNVDDMMQELLSDV